MSPPRFDGEELLAGALYVAGAVGLLAVAAALVGVAAWIVRWGFGA